MIVRGNISAEKSRSIIGEHSSDLPKNESRSSRVIHPNFISRFPVRLPFECNPELLCIVLGHIQNRVGLRETSGKQARNHVGSVVDAALRCVNGEQLLQPEGCRATCEECATGQSRDVGDEDHKTKERGLLLDLASFTCYLVALQKQRLGD